MAQTIFTKNKNNDIYLDVVGIALGNPWIEPYHQYDVSEYAHGVGLISQGQLNLLKEKEAKCQRELSKKKYNQRVCTHLLDDVLDASTVKGRAKVVMYDSRQFTSTASFPPQHEEVEKYLNRQDVRAALHVSSCPHVFAECTDPPYNALLRWEGLGSSEALADVLNRGVNVLVYSGVHDIICNHIGIEKVLRNLVWNGQHSWSKSGSSAWLIDNKPVGYMTSYGNLHNLRVLNAGHMVPLDQPSVAVEMIAWFVNRKGKIVVGETSLKSSAKEVDCNDVSDAQLHLQGTLQSSQSENKRYISTSTTPSPAPKLSLSSEICDNSIRLRKSCNVNVSAIFIHDVSLMHIPRQMMSSVLLLDIKNALFHNKNFRGLHVLVTVSMNQMQADLLLRGDSELVSSCIEALNSQLQNESSRLRIGLLSGSLLFLNVSRGEEKSTIDFGNSFEMNDIPVLSFGIILLIAILFCRRRICICFSSVYFDILRAIGLNAEISRRKN